MIYVGFSRPQKWKLFSWLIRMYQGGTNYSHVYIKFNMPVGDDSVPMVWEASYGEVHLITYENFLKRNKAVYEFELKCELENWMDMLKFMLSKLQKPYGKKTIIGLLLYDAFGWRLWSDGSESFICSEAVARLLGMCPDQSSCDYLTPKDLYKLMEDRCCSQS